MNTNQNRNLIIGIVVAAFLLLACVCALVVALFARGLGGGPSLGIVRGSGDIVTETREVRDFTDVRVGNAFEVDIVQADRFQVTISADDNIMRYVEVTKEGNTLRIRLQPGRGYQNVTARAQVEMPSIERLDLSGAARGNLKGFANLADFRLELSGASTLRGDLTAQRAGFDLSGASIVDVTGSADRLTLDGSGASSVRLGRFTVREADIELSGASNGELIVTERLDVDLSGASRLVYEGEPTVGRQDVSGGSSLQRR